MERIRMTLSKIFEGAVSPLELTGVFLSIITLRVFVEQFLAKTVEISVYEIFIEWIHNFFFFSITFLLIWLLLAYFLRINPKNLSRLFLWASLLIVFPPIFDMAKTNGEVFWSFYVIGGPEELAKNFITVFGNLPSGIVYFGTRIVFLASIFFVFLLIWARTGKIIKAALSAVITYFSFFIMGSFPSLFFLAASPFLGQKISEIKPFRVAQFFGSPENIWGISSIGIKYSFAWKLGIIYYPILIGLLAFIFWNINRGKFLAVIKNFRFPQVVYHSGIFFIGMGLGYLKFKDNLTIDIFAVAAAGTLLLSILLAWKASVVVNDVYDLEIDRISNPDRPLPRKLFEIGEYIQFGIICFFLSLLGGLAIGFKFFVLLLIYQILAWFYSAAPLRLKKFPAVATFTSSLASLVVLFLGYILVAKNQSVETLSWRVILLLIFGYTLSLPIKDFKDMAGDAKGRIWTIPVLFGEAKSRLIVATGVFISFVSSVFFLNELRLFWWALLAGAVAFWIITSKKTKPRELFLKIMGVAFAYGLILVRVVFW